MLDYDGLGLLALLGLLADVAQLLLCQGGCSASLLLGVTYGKREFVRGFLFREIATFEIQ